MRLVYAGRLTWWAEVEASLEGVSGWFRDGSGWHGSCPVSHYGSCWIARCTDGRVLVACSACGSPLSYSLLREHLLEIFHEAAVAFRSEDRWLRSKPCACCWNPTGVSSESKSPVLCIGCQYDAENESFYIIGEDEDETLDPDPGFDGDDPDYLSDLYEWVPDE